MQQRRHLDDVEQVEYALFPAKREMPIPEPRLLEAQDRGLWETPSPEMRERLRSLLLESESVLEGRDEVTR